RRRLRSPHRALVGPSGSAGAHNVSTAGGSIAGDALATLEGCRHSPHDVSERLEMSQSGITGSEVFELF
ncbi:MAG: hypothetical protein MUD02_08050, partial [Bacteroidales bacterium]|nr:hypothetical protein [Bacteroidales bacterium]